MEATWNDETTSPTSHLRGVNGSAASSHASGGSQGLTSTTVGPAIRLRTLHDCAPPSLAASLALEAAGVVGAWVGPAAGATALTSDGSWQHGGGWWTLQV